MEHFTGVNLVLIHLFLTNFPLGILLPLGGLLAGLFGVDEWLSGVSAFIASSQRTSDVFFFVDSSFRNSIVPTILLSLELLQSLVEKLTDSNDSNGCQPLSWSLSFSVLTPCKGVFNTFGPPSLGMIFDSAF